MRSPRTRGALLANLLAIAWLQPASGALAQPRPSFLTFESGQVHPLALSLDNTRLFAVNTPGNRLEIFDLGGSGDDGSIDTPFRFSSAEPFRLIDT